MRKEGSRVRGDGELIFQCWRCSGESTSQLHPAACSHYMPVRVLSAFCERPHFNSLLPLVCVLWSSSQRRGLRPSLQGIGAWSQNVIIIMLLLYSLSQGSPRPAPRFSDCRRLTAQPVVLIRPMIYYAKGYKAKWAKRKGTWHEVQENPGTSFQE